MKITTMIVCQEMQALTQSPDLCQLLQQYDVMNDEMQFRFVSGGRAVMFNCWTQDLENSFHAFSEKILKPAAAAWLELQPPYTLGPMDLRSMHHGVQWAELEPA